MHQFYFYYLTVSGCTNLLAFNPFNRPRPNPLILPLPSVPTVSVLPVISGSFDILKSIQLSLFKFFTCLLNSLPVVRMGDSPTNSTLSKFYTYSSSSFSYDSSLK